jgi:cell division protein FtsB
MSTENEEQLDTEDTGVEIELDAEVESEESSKPKRAEAQTASDGDELESYSQKVQGRIKKLTEKYRKEERDREEAVTMAQRLLDENTKLKSQVKNLDKGYVNSEESRIKGQVAAVKQQYREAYDSGDSDAMFAAQEQLSQMTLMQERVRAAKHRLTVEEQEPAPQQIQQPAAAPQPKAAKPDPRAQEWADKNEWFGSDEVMTYASFGIHRKLVEEEGFDPASDEYYSEVDKRMRSEFPNKFQPAKKSGGAQVAPAGASATRSTAKSGRRSVKLSPSQIAMAKRLNVPLEEYAKYVKD